MNRDKFFAELKRRNVYKVAVAYGVVAWLVVQIATATFPVLELPNWAAKMVIVLAALGFPIALVIAWAFEMTPEGMKRTEDIGPDEKIPQWSGRKFAALIVVVAVLAAGLLAFQVFRARSTSRVEGGAAATPTSESLAGARSSVPDRSIAVLPFESLSEDKANAYFADGIQDEILTRLSKIADLKVISRTSTQRYKSAPNDLKEIAKQLNVANILEGTVQRSNDQVRISVQLIKAANDSHLWAETYDRKLVDVFQVESDVAQKIASRLEAKLTGNEVTAISTGGTTNQEAYDAYLHALALRNSQLDPDEIRCRDYLREAVKLDPSFADAWSELAVAEASRYFFPEESAAQKERARTAAETALRLAPDAADAKGAMGLYQYYVEKNYDEALVWLERARAIAPNDWKLIASTALVKRRQGKLDETIALERRAAELDPLNVGIWSNLGRSYRARRDLANARASFDRGLAASPGNLSLVVDAAETFLAAGDLEAAWRMVRDLKPPPSDNDTFGFKLILRVFRREYQEALELTNSSLQAQTSPLGIALGHHALGMAHSALGDATGARTFFAQAESELNALRAKREGGIIVLEVLADQKAIEGDREAVERLDAECAQIRSKDKWTAPMADENAARHFAVMGDAERAIPLLDRCLHTVYAQAITPAYLRLDPMFDPIRRDPRFENLANAK